MRKEEGQPLECIDISCSSSASTTFPFTPLWVLPIALLYISLAPSCCTRAEKVRFCEGHEINPSNRFMCKGMLDLNMLITRITRFSAVGKIMCHTLRTKGLFSKHFTVDILPTHRLWPPKSLQNIQVQCASIR